MLYWEVKRDCEVFNRLNGSVECLLQGELLTKAEMQRFIDSSFGFKPEHIAIKVNVSPKNTYWSFGSRRAYNNTER